MDYGGDNMLTKLPRRFPFKFSIPGNVVNLIIFGAKKLWDKLADSKISEEISCKDKFKLENREDIIDYNKLLNKFIIEIEEELYTIEEKIISECIEYYEELILLVKYVENDKNINLHSKSIIRSVERLKRNIKGDLVKNLYRSISLDNIKLRGVLSLPAGELKGKKLEEFKYNVIKKVVDDFILDTRFSLEDLGEEISNDLNIIISDISKNSDMLLKELTILEESKDNEKKIRELMKLSEEKILLCNGIINELRM